MEHENDQHWWVITTHARHLDALMRSACHFGFPFRGQQFWEPLPKIKTNNPLDASERNHNLINNAKKMDIYRAQWFVWGTMLYWTRYISVVWHCQWTEGINTSINGYTLSYAQMFSCLFPWNNLFKLLSVILQVLCCYRSDYSLLRPFLNHYAIC